MSSLATLSYVTNLLDQLFPSQDNSSFIPIILLGCLFGLFGAIVSYCHAKISIFSLISMSHLAISELITNFFRAVVLNFSCGSALIILEFFHGTQSQNNRPYLTVVTYVCFLLFG